MRKPPIVSREDLDAELEDLGLVRYVDLDVSSPPRVVLNVREAPSEGVVRRPPASERLEILLRRLRDRGALGVRWELSERRTVLHARPVGRMTMLGVTLWQPWATQVFDPIDPKGVENRRTLRPAKELLVGALDERPFFAVHAGMNYDPAPAAIAAGAAPRADGTDWPFPKGARVPSRSRCPLGAVVGVARVRHGWDAVRGEAFGVEPGDSVKAETLPLERWWLGPIGWRLAHAIPIDPVVPCRGMLGCWTLPDDVARLVARRAAAVVDADLMGRAYEGAPGEPRNHVDRTRMTVVELVRASNLLARAAK